MVEYKKERDNLVCVVKGNLIASNVPGIREELLEYVETDQEWKKLTLDLSKTDSIDSIGVNLLVNLYKKVDAESKEFAAIGCNEPILEVLKLFRLDQHFNIQTM